jgi:hypothetical protein
VSVGETLGVPVEEMIVPSVLVLEFVVGTETGVEVREVGDGAEEGVG